MKEIKLSKDNKYLKNAALVRQISESTGSDIFVSCKKLDQIIPGDDAMDTQECAVFCHECNRLGTLDAVISAYGQ